MEEPNYYRMKELEAIVAKRIKMDDDDAIPKARIELKELKKAMKKWRAETLA